MAVTAAVGAAGSGTGASASGTYDHTPTLREELVFVVAAMNSSQTSAPTIATPSGWSAGPTGNTRITVGVTNRGTTLAVFRKTAVGGDASPSAAVGNGNGWVAFCAQLAGVDPGEPVDADGSVTALTASSATSGSVTLPGVTPAVTGDYVLSAGFEFGGLTPTLSWTGTSGLASGTVGSAPSIGLAIAGQVVTGKGTTVAPTLAWTGQSQRGFINGGVSVAFRAARVFLADSSGAWIPAAAQKL